MVADSDRSRMADAAMEIIGVHGSRAREVVMLPGPEARKIGDAIAVAIIRSNDSFSSSMLAAALDELSCAWGGGAPIGWRCLI